MKSLNHPNPELVSELAGKVVKMMDTFKVDLGTALFNAYAESQDTPWGTFWNNVRPASLMLLNSKQAEKPVHSKPLTHADAVHQALAKIEKGAIVIIVP